jgi:hypothetical protein
MQRRQASHASGQSHLAGLLQSASDQSYVVLRRIKYLVRRSVARILNYCQTQKLHSALSTYLPTPIVQKNEAKAVVAEARMLALYDYAWNMMQNGPRRHLELLPAAGCLCLSSGVTVRSAAYLAPTALQQRQQQQQQRARKAAQQRTVSAPQIHAPAPAIQVWTTGPLQRAVTQVAM